MSTGWLKIRNSSTVYQFWELMGDFKNMINPLSSFLRAANHRLFSLSLYKVLEKLSDDAIV